MQNNPGRHQSVQKKSIREKIAETVDISKDIILNTSLIKLTGTSEAVIENYKAIIEYSDKKIRIKSNPQIIDISGKYLEIRAITDELLCVSGEISNIAFTED